MSTPTFIAVARFGLGAKPGELAAVGRDPRSWALGQLGTEARAPRALADMPSSHAAALNVTRLNPANVPEVERNLRRVARESYVVEAGARTQAQIETDQPLRERLVAFWSNHFTVSVQRPVILGLAGPFEREAIRPHVLGRFRDMLLAVARHPAMLLYLDQAASIGPNSMAGQRRGRGLNENLAREILELHTLGVEGGYTQADVTSFAHILTGWSITRDNDGGQPGAFLFRPRVHEPGAKQLLGERFVEAGEREGVAALEMLARHPATARHVATKLARHFIADQPPAAAIDRLTQVFRDSDGDLGQVTRALVELPQAWSAPLTKVKTPNEYIVSALRALGIESVEAPKLFGALQLLGQAPFAAPSPAGWPDTADQWIGPEAVMRRAEWAMALAQRVHQRAQPSTVMETALGAATRPETRKSAERAASAADAIALVLASPEFQRR